MAYIYKITNLLNGKVYIGQTGRTVEARWKEHQKDSTRRTFEQRPLYRAINKYGIENFSIETIEETDSPNERERFWIEYYGSYKNGYNATVGGDGTPYIDYDLVVATYKEVQNMSEVARRMNISCDAVEYILHIKQIPIISSAVVLARATSKVVNQYSLDGHYIQSFSSAIAAARALNVITTTSNGASSHITDVCRGKRKTAYGYKWKFSET